VRVVRAPAQASEIDSLVQQYVDQNLINQVIETKPAFNGIRPRDRSLPRNGDGVWLDSGEDGGAASATSPRPKRVPGSAR
jgi:hypothetical protein